MGSNVDRTLDSILFDKDWYSPDCKYRGELVKVYGIEYYMCSNKNIVIEWGNKGHVSLRKLDTSNSTPMYLGNCKICKYRRRS